MKIALGQINTTVGDFSGNAAKIIDLSRRAMADGAGLIIFPEMSVCGYPARDWVEKPFFVAKSQSTTDEIARATRATACLARNMASGLPQAETLHGQHIQVRAWRDHSAGIA